jgi:tyrosine-protein phosphatase YwqE
MKDAHMQGIALIINTGYQYQPQYSNVIRSDKQDKRRAHTPQDHRGNQVHWSGLINNGQESLY